MKTDRSMKLKHLQSIQTWSEKRPLNLNSCSIELPRIVQIKACAWLQNIYLLPFGWTDPLSLNPSHNPKRIKKKLFHKYIFGGYSKVSNIVLFVVLSHHLGSCYVQNVLDLFILEFPLYIFYLDLYWASYNLLWIATAAKSYNVQ